MIKYVIFVYTANVLHNKNDVKSTLTQVFWNIFYILQTYV